MPTPATRRNSIPGDFLLALLIGLPVVSYPLSWLPKSWAHFRYDCTLPLPQIFLVAGLLASAVWLLCGRSRDEPEEGNAGILLPSLAILPLLAIMLSAVASIRSSEHSQFGLALLPRLAGNLAIFLVAARTPRSRLAELGGWWILLAVIVAANGLLRLGSEPEFLSTFGNGDFLGAYLAASFLMMVCYGGVGSILGSIIVVVAMCFCRSRGAWLALGIVGLSSFLNFHNRFFRREASRAVIVIAIMATFAFLIRTYALQQWRTEVRPVIWKATVQMITARPWVGHGLGAYVAVYPKYRLPEYFLRLKATNVTDHAHNELLETAAEQGLFGLAAMLWLWALAIKCGFGASRRAEGVNRRVLWGMLGAMLIFMLHGLVDIDLRYLPNQSLLWLLMGLLVGADATPSHWRRITIPSRAIRCCLAGICLAFGLWILVAAIFRPLQADWLDRQARIAEERGDLLMAAQHAQNALRLDPFRLSTRYLLAGVFSRLPDPSARELAIEQCLQIEEQAPDYADVTYNLGQLRLSAGATAEAIIYLRRAVEINPYDVQRRIVLASALHEVGQDEEARHQLER